MAFWSPPSPPPPPPFTGLDAIRRDAPAYLGMLALGTVPALDLAAIEGAAPSARIAYIFALAVGTVYLGCKRQDINQDEVSAVGLENAALAPVFASLSLGGLYFLITYTGLDAGGLLKATACLLATFSAADVLENYAQLALLPPASRAEDEPGRADAAAAAALAGALLLAGAYLQGPEYTGGLWSLPAFAALNNYLAWPICLTALGLIFLDGYTTGALLLGGLFCYDAFFVFKSDVMITVATKLEAPVKILFPGSPQALAEGRYPFSVLGLGDVAIPGAFVALLRQFDAQNAKAAPAPPGRAPAAAPAAAPRDGAGRPTYASPYFTAGMVGYAAGLVGTFAANTLTGSGQPALVYIVPSLLLSSAGTAALRGELGALWAFESPRAQQAKAEMEARREERRAARSE